jgi:hypothetical protein
VHKVLFQYASDKEENKAALNFHLSKREQKDIVTSVHSIANAKSFERLKELLHLKDTTRVQVKKAITPY